MRACTLFSFRLCSQHRERVDCGQPQERAAESKEIKVDLTARQGNEIRCARAVGAGVESGRASRCDYAPAKCVPSAITSNKQIVNVVLASALLSCAIFALGSDQVERLTITGADYACTSSPGRSLITPRASFINAR